MLVIVCQFGEVDGVLWGQNTYAPARNTVSGAEYCQDVFRSRH